MLAFAHGFDINPKQSQALNEYNGHDQTLNLLIHLNNKQGTSVKMQNIATQLFIDKKTMLIVILLKNSIG